jgi:predicted ATP-grasp superfamily ATP-dependent carboligase
MINFIGKVPLKKMSILIPDGESGFCQSVVMCLSQVRGLRIYVLSTAGNTRSRFSIQKAKYIYIKRGQTDYEWVNSIKQYANDLGIDVILPTGQYAISLMSAHKNLFPLKINIVPLPPLNSFNIAADKWLLAEFLFENNLPLPTTILFKSTDQFSNDLSAIDFPALIKPRNLGGGVGIELWKDQTELLKHLQENKNSEEVIVQSFIKGYNIGCSVLCQDGEILAYTIQKELLKSGSQFGPSGGIVFIYEENVYSLVKQLILKLNWSGIANIDMRYDEKDNTFKILEINPRFWVSLIGSLSVGVNFPYLACMTSQKILYSQPKYLFKPFYYFRLIARMKRARTIHTIEQKFNLFNDTDLRYIIRDPLPLMVRFLYRLIVKLLRKIFTQKRLMLLKKLTANFRI